MKAKRSCQPLLSFRRLDEETSSSGEGMINLPWFCVNIYQNQSRNSGRKDGQIEGSGGLVQVENETQTPSEVDWKNIFSNCSKQTKAKAGHKTDKKGGKKQSECAGKRGGDRKTSNAQ